MNTDTQALLQQLTLEEKAALVTGLSPWETVPVERLGIPSIIVSDGPHGVRRAQDMAADSLPATCFPTASALAATWDVDLIYELGQALADECISIGVDVLLGPGNNMKRSPLCGRNFEYYSEDPFLGGEMVTHFIDGVQSKGIGTSLKHYAVNNQETERMTVSAEVNERTLHEIYLAGFERAVKQAHPWTVMCGYNRVNGTYCSEHHHLLTEILKDDWGFEGVVVSDWGAIHDRVKAVKAGLDLEMPGPQKLRTQGVVAAVRNGDLDEAALDKAVLRVLNLVAKAQQTPKKHTSLNIDAHHALARRISGETIVLLKNEGNVLPLKDEQLIAVIGMAARSPHFQGGGSSRINATRVDNPLEELQKIATSAEFRYAPGYTMEEQGLDQGLIDEAVATATGSDVALLYIALPKFKESEGYDRPDIDLTIQQVALIKAVAAAQPRCVVILNNGSAVAMSEWIDDVAVVLEAWLMGQAGGGAIADVLTGRVNPSGRLTETFPLKLSDTPSHLNFPGEKGKVNYGEGLFIGYRYYDAVERDVLFPFGFGLSYTTFEMSGLKLDRQLLHSGESLIVSVDVTNTGAVAGKETVQVYVRDIASSLVRPLKELKGFAKVSLGAGERQTVSITLDERAFMYYEPELGGWLAESGEFEILIGRSAADIVLRETVTLASDQRAPNRLTRDSSLHDWLSHPRGGDFLRARIDSLFIKRAAPNGEMRSVVEVVPWIHEVPLETALSFFGNGLAVTPEQQADQLIAEFYQS